MTCFQRIGSQLVIRVCPQTNENPRVVKRKLYRKVVRRIVLERCPTVHVGGFQWTILESFPTIHLKDCPMYLFGGLSNKILSKIEQCVFKNKNLFFLTQCFLQLAYACVRELVRAREVEKGESHSHP